MLTELKTFHKTDKKLKDSGPENKKIQLHNANECGREGHGHRSRVTVTEYLF
jgi:hypothetical protein